MTMKKWLACSFTCCVTAAMTLAAVPDARAHDSATVVRSGDYSDDVFVNGMHVTVDGRLSQDLFVAGDHVEVSGQVEGDVFAIGGGLDLSGAVSGAVLAAGGHIRLGGDIKDSVVILGVKVDLDAAVEGDVLLTAVHADINGPIRGDVRASGGKITFHREVGGNVLAGGGRVELSDTADIRGKVTIGANKLYVGGQIGGGLKAAAREIVLAGVIEGDVKLIANKITLLPSARIRGNLVYRSPQAIKFESASQVVGDITYVQSEEMRRSMGVLFVIAGGTHLVVVLGMVLIAALFIIVAPPLFPSVEDRIRRQKWKTFGLGLAFLVGGPFAITLLMVTAIGIPLALFVLALYFLIVVTGILGGCYALGQKFFSLIKQDFRGLAWRQIAAAATGSVFLGLITLAPVVGAVILILTTALGVGALLSEGYRLCRGRAVTTNI